MNPRQHLRKRAREVKAAMGAPLMTHQEVAEQLRISPERVRQIEDEIFMKIVARMNPTLLEMGAA